MGTDLHLPGSSEPRCRAQVVVSLSNAFYSSIFAFRFVKCTRLRAVTSFDLLLSMPWRVRASGKSRPLYSPNPGC